MFGPITPFSELGSTLTKGSSARTSLALANWFCSVIICSCWVLTWVCGAATCAFKAANSPAIASCGRKC